MIAESVFGFTQYSAVSVHHHLDCGFDYPRHSWDVLAPTDNMTKKDIPQGQSSSTVK